MVIAFSLAIICYMLALEPFGFVFSSFVFLIVSTRVLGSTNWIANVGASVVTILGIYIIFQTAFFGRFATGRSPKGMAGWNAISQVAAMNEALGYFLISFLDWKLVALTAAGTFAGIYIGAIPGLSVTMAVSILISFTFKWEVNQALALISGIFLGGVYGGSRSAILLNIPGAPAPLPLVLTATRLPSAARPEQQSV